jgi:hypothetical protein
MKEHGIKRIIRHKETQEFFGETGWTQRREEAREFSSTWEAIRCSAKLRLQKSNLVLVFAESRELVMDMASFGPEHNSSFLVKAL